MSTELKVKNRSEVGTGCSRRLRRDGQVPAVLYGLDKTPQQFSVITKDLEIILKSDSQLIQLAPEKGKKINALIKDIQYNYLKGETVHVDFQEIDMKEEISATVTIVPTGTAVGTAKGGIFNQLVYELEVSCLPTDLPETVTVDVSGMDIEDTLYVKDIVLPENVTAESEEDSVIFNMTQPKVKEDTEEEESAEEEKSEEESSEA
ncbi:MAG: 50S ribosomal protein L25 [bacterium]|nr:50S ribosomal protein L25 [bacterium]